MRDVRPNFLLHLELPAEDLLVSESGLMDVFQKNDIESRCRVELTRVRDQQGLEGQRSRRGTGLKGPSRPDLCDFCLSYR